MNYQTPLLWTLRWASALGLASLTLTHEISAPYLYAGWGGWMASFGLDRKPEWEKRLRSLETAAGVGMISVFLLDLFFWGQTIFVCVAHFLLLFQLFKLLGLKERKDGLQILMFSFFQMLSACTLSVDAWQAVVLLLLIPIATAGLFWQQIAREAEASGQPPPAAASRPYRRWVTAICVIAIPVNIVLATAMFIIFPRLAFRTAFAGLGMGRSGYNEQVNLAQAGVLNLDNSAVLWMQITPVQDRQRWKGYLRGATLDVFDGRKWSRRVAQISQTQYSDTNGVFKFGQRQRNDHGLRQTITLVNTAGATLFGSPFVGEAVAPFATLQYMMDGSVRWAMGWRKPLHYTVVSFDQPLAHSAAAPGVGRANYLQLPDISFKRTRVLLRQITRGQRTPLAQGQAIEKHLRGTYQYSLDQGVRASANPVEDFLFVRQRGPCGHFASAMAVMLRLQGIPARVAAGYYKGTWNNQLQQVLFRERDAHAWVEAYIPKMGWVLFDPSPRTAAVPTTQKWLLRLQEQWETVNYQWDRLVIEYDLYSQVKTLQEIQSNTNRMNAALSGWVDRNLMGFKRPGSQLRTQNSEKTAPAVSPLFMTAFFFILTALSVFWRFRKRSSRVDPAIAFYKNFLDQMARKGFPKIPSETGWEYANRLRQEPDYELLLQITQRYYHTRFSGRS